MNLFGSLQNQSKQLDSLVVFDLSSPFSQVYMSKIDLCPYDVFLCDEPYIPGKEYELISRPLLKYGIRIYESPKSEESHYLIRMNSKQIVGLPSVILQVICNSWQLSSERIPLHASAIIHKNSTYLFCAPSGGGKSTIGCLSMEIGDMAIDEDQVMIWESQAHTYSANAWAKSLVSSSLPIKAVFRIVKSHEDHLTRLTERQTSVLLWEQSMESTGGMFSRRNAARLLNNIGKLARTIPGYELHFRKSPDFWKLIDAEFGING